MNDRFNITSGVTENVFNYLPENDEQNINKRMQLFYKIGILKNFAKFKRKHLCWNQFFNKFSGLYPATLVN